MIEGIWVKLRPALIVVEQSFGKIFRETYFGKGTFGSGAEGSKQSGCCMIRSSPIKPRFWVKPLARSSANDRIRRASAAGAAKEGRVLFSLFRGMMTGEVMQMLGAY